MLQQPTVMYTYYMKDAQCFWHKCDDSINVHDFDDNQICINGVNADSFFQACRNAMCSKMSLFNELKRNHNREYAEEMITALQEYLNPHTSEESTDAN